MRETPKNYRKFFRQDLRDINNFSRTFHMDKLPELFKTYLLSRKSLSSVTAKNYVSDIRKFIVWFETSFGKRFQVNDLTLDVVTLFQKANGDKLVNNVYGQLSTISGQSSPRSFERYLSTLRRFSEFLKEEEYIQDNPFDQIINDKQSIINKSDPWFLKEFKDYLYIDGGSKSTIKNYLVDIRAFTSWIKESQIKYQPDGINTKDYIKLIANVAIDNYKERLMSVLHLSPRSINRKLSSIRKYLQFAQSQGHLEQFSRLQTPNIGGQVVLKRGLNLKDFEQIQDRTDKILDSSHSRIPPIRLLRKLLAPYFNLEDSIASYIARLINNGRLRRAQYRTGLRQNASKLNQGFFTFVSNIPKAIYAPNEISLVGLSWQNKLIHHAKHTRPKWYKRYHSYSIVHYFHFAILVIYASALGFIVYTGLFPEARKQMASASPKAVSRVLSFHGTLIDNNDKPITSEADLRFAIYDNETASGSALLWQEVQQSITPDQNGEFSVLLGSRNSMPATIFRDYDSLYLGISIGQTPELAPREKLPSVSYAKNSETLQGMLPITDSSKGKNVILALDSSGNLTFTGSASPTFAAIGGQFKLSGKTLILATEDSSNGDISIVPDGIGRVNIEKPLVNNSTAGNFAPGSVEVNDKMSVIATESAVAAFVINNDATGGDIFTASSSGTNRFVIANDGDIGFSAGASLDTISTGTLSIGNTTATTLSLGRFGREIVLPAFTGKNGVLYGANGTGILSQAITSAPSLCLLSGERNPSWGTCDLAWGQGSGTLFSNNSTMDLLIGSRATASAEFAITGVGNGNPMVSIFATINSNGLSLNASNATIQSLNKNTLTIGGTSTGNIILSALGGSGKVGIGVSVPGQELEVNGDIRLDANEPATTNGLCHSGANSDTTFADRDIVACSASPADIAEWYETTAGVQEAEILVATNNKITYMAQKTNPESGELEGKVESQIAILTESTEPYQNNIIGIVSSSPYQTFGRDIHDYAKNPRAVALAGRVPLKVSVENGPIQIGDPITSSSIPGVGMKATKSGKIVGFALADYDADAIGKIIVYIDSSTYHKSVAEELESLTLGAINAGNVIASSLNVATNSVTIAGQSLSDYIAQIVAEIVDSGQLSVVRSQSIVSPLASIDQIRTNIISPLADNSEIAVSLHDSKFIIHDSATSSGSVVASIDNTGNATFSGSLTSDKLQTTDASISGQLATDNLSANEATISGTLYADRIQANSIDGLESNTDFLDIKNLSGDFATFRQGLIAFGPATFNQVTAIDSMSIGATLLIGQNSINTLSETLEIQSLKQGSISFMAGAIRIETDGTLKVLNNAEFASNVSIKGTLSANIISPLPNSDIVLNLGNQEAGSTNQELHDSKFMIHDSSNSAVLSINDRGNVVASGSGTFNKLNLSLAKQALAISDIEAVASGSAGAAVVKQYRGEITIKNQNVTENSLIYITPVGNTNGKVLYLLRQTAEDPLQVGVEGSFTVGINIPSTTTDIKFNWIIVN